MGNKDLEFIDVHEAKIRSITMEAPEGYEFGHIVKAEVEMRVGKIEFSQDKEGNVVRTVSLFVDGCHIKESYDPSQDFGTVSGSASGGAAVIDEDDDDMDLGDSPEVTSPEGYQVDTSTGEVNNPSIQTDVDEDDDFAAGF